MSDFIIIDGDQVTFQPSFGAATITPIPGNISGSGKATVNEKAVCIEGDEKTVEVTNVPYIHAAFVGGMGTLKIVGLASDQLADHTKSGEEKMILKGSTFDAKLEVTVKAIDPSGAQDPMSEHSGGKGEFITTNTKFKGS